MRNIESKAKYHRINDSCFNYELDSSGEVILLEIYDPEYDNLREDELENVLQFVSGFKKLESLSIEVESFLIKDLSFLKDLDNLRYIEIECYTEIENLDFLENLVELEFISIQSSKIKDISHLSKFSKLHTIHISNALIEDISPLKDLEKIKSVNFPNNLIQNIGCILDLCDLEYLALGNNEIIDISVLSKFSNLKSISLNNNSIESIQDLKANHEMLYINVANNKLCNIEIIKNFPKLHTLNIANNFIDDISPLKHCHNIQNLNVSHNRITNFTEVGLLENLFFAQLDGNKLNSQFQFHFQSQLGYLYMSDCGILDNVNFLINQTTIKILNLNNNAIKDFSGLVNLHSLVDLHLINNAIYNSFPVHYFSEPHSIDLSGNDFGNKRFAIYKGYQQYNYQDEDSGLIEELRRMEADFYYNNGDYDAALAYYYFDKSTKETIEIYLNKIYATSAEETVYIKYYFSKIFNIVAGNEEFYKIIQDHFKNLTIKLEKVKQPEKDKMLEFLNNEKNGQYGFYQFSLKEFYYYENEIPNAQLTDEIIFLKGSLNLTRENLKSKLYYLKLLKSRSSPFYYNLFHKIKYVLKMNFAYTEEERKQHDYYFNVINNLENIEVQEPPNVFSDYSPNSKYYQFTHYKSPLRPPQSSSSSNFDKFLGVILFILVIIIMFLLVGTIFAFLRFWAA